MATKLTIADLRDPTKFKTERRVISFEPHLRTVTDPTTGKTVILDVTPERINAIYQEAKSLEAVGYFPRITDGHVPQGRMPNGQPWPMPPLVGFMSNPEIVTENGKPCIAYDYHFRLPYSNIMSERPNRSAEFAYTKDQIRGTALLLQDPALDMGTMHQFSGNDPLCYYGVSDMPEQPKPGEKKEEPTAGKAALMKEIMAAMLEAFPGLASMAAGGGAGAGATGAAPTVPNAAACATPSPTAVMPGAEKTANFQGNELVLYQQNLALQAQINAITQSSDQAECVHLVNGLIMARYELDAPYELSLLRSLPKAARPAYVENLRKRSKLLPGAVPIPVLAGNIDYSRLTVDTQPKSHAGEMTKEQADQALELSQRTHCDYATAKAQILGRK